MASPLFSEIQRETIKLDAPLELSVLISTSPGSYQEHKICFKNESGAALIGWDAVRYSMAYASLGIQLEKVCWDLLHNYKISLSMQKYFAG